MQYTMDQSQKLCELHKDRINYHGVRDLFIFCISQMRSIGYAESQFGSKSSISWIPSKINRPAYAIQDIKFKCLDVLIKFLKKSSFLKIWITSKHDTKTLRIHKLVYSLLGKNWVGPFAFSHHGPDSATKIDSGLGVFTAKQLINYRG